LIVWSARPDAELGRVNPMGRKRQRQRGGAREGTNQEASAVDGHGAHMMRPGS
jgi:hypothetical protein